jgi:ATP phosphoribosyltransferase
LKKRILVFITNKINSDALLVLPKNSGLEEYRKEFEKLGNKKIIVRAEDVPLFVNKLKEKGNKCIGLTGEDLFTEYQKQSTKAETKIIQRIPWKDNKTMFGKPALCLLGKKSFKKINESNIAINKKYSFLANNFLEGINCSKIYFSGCTETAAETNLADFVIDIVYSGKSAEESGLKVLKKIFSSDVVVIG